tara:strand:+ start:222 stop:1145 length:924 start_codon:yes stop_codon:yes gene_type:complete
MNLKGKEYILDVSDKKSTYYIDDIIVSVAKGDDKVGTYRCKDKSKETLSVFPLGKPQGKPMIAFAITYDMLKKLFSVTSQTVDVKYQSHNLIFDSGRVCGTDRFKAVYYNVECSKTYKDKYFLIDKELSKYLDLFKKSRELFIFKQKYKSRDCFGITDKRNILISTKNLSKFERIPSVNDVAKPFKNGRYFYLKKDHLKQIKSNGSEFLTFNDRFMYDEKGNQINIRIADESEYSFNADNTKFFGCFMSNTTKLKSDEPKVQEKFEKCEYLISAKLLLETSLGINSTFRISLPHKKGKDNVMYLEYK